MIVSGIEVLEADCFKLHCFDAPTGTKFFLICDPTHVVGNLLRQVYNAYADYVMKNPFYEMEMPIHCELFALALEKMMHEQNVQKKKDKTF